MRMYDLIQKKRNGRILGEDEIEWMIQAYISEKIPDYQMAAMLMAIYFQGMNEEETLHLTMTMAHSGDMLDLSKISGIKVDKHSTGGVGDKITLILAPLVAANGVPVAKMSGRGLGHTGGTIDKLESIPGFSTSLPPQQFIEQVNDIQIALAGQTANLAPADKKLYALRDVTATVDQLSLIASSIMSKKIASGADAIVLDVKTGSGAFMKQTKDAVALAKEMAQIGANAGKQTTAIISDMDQPLGYYIGNALEVREAIETLYGNGPEDLTHLTLALGSYMLLAAKKTTTYEEGVSLLQETINNGKGLEKLRQFIKAQGGNETVVSDPSLLPLASFIEPVPAPKSGYVTQIQCEEIGVASLLLGGGRETKESAIDLSVGIVLNKKCGDYVKQNEPLAFLHSNDHNKTRLAMARLQNSYSIDEKKAPERPLIHGIVDASSIA